MESWENNQISSNFRSSDFLKQEIEGFRKKFLLNTITDRDIYIISSDEEMAEALNSKLRCI